MKMNKRCSWQCQVWLMVCWASLLLGGNSVSGYAEPEVRLTQVFEGQQADTAFVVESLLEGFEIPWSLAFLNPQHLLIAERSGGLYVYRVKQADVVPIAHPLPVFAEGQGGLLDLALAPNRSWMYVTYVQDTQQGGVTVLARAEINLQPDVQEAAANQEVLLINWQSLLVTQSANSSGRHYGSRIAFDQAGHVFFSVGDRGHRPNGQDLTTHAGKILRVTLAGKAPSSNPFVKQSGVLPEIWSYGHRNPQGLFFDQLAGVLWSSEHGPRGGDEINIIEAGENYGWPVVSHGMEYWGPKAVGEATSKQGMRDPVKVYTPSIAPSGLLVYKGQAFKAWQGTLFGGALKLRHLNHVVVARAEQRVTETRLLEDLNERIRDVIEGPEGWLYFSSDAGKIYRMRPLDS